MKRRETIIALLSLLSLLTAIAAYQQWQPAPKVEAPAKKTVLKIPEKKKMVVVAPSNLDWGQLSRDEMDELTSYFGGGEEGKKKSANSLDWESHVNLGQTVITNAYEGKSGELVVSQLTPQINNGGVPNSPVKFKVSTSAIGLDGHAKKIASYDLPMFETRGGGLESAMRVIDASGSHMINLFAKRKGDGTSFAIKATGGFSNPTPSSTAE